MGTVDRWTEVGVSGWIETTAIPLFQLHVHSIKVEYTNGGSSCTSSVSNSGKQIRLVAAAAESSYNSQRGDHLLASIGQTLSKP